MNGRETVITGKIGDNTRYFLNGAGILLHMYKGTGMVKAGDEGRPYVLRYANTPTWKTVDMVMENLVKWVEY